MPDLTKPGGIKFLKQILRFKDPARRRSFYVILYRPKTLPKQKIPVVIVSHGLASRPEDFNAIAEFLASYGFLVALPQHRGSDLRQAKDLLEGFSGVVFETQEFIDRPKDISFVLDKLEKLNQKEYKGRLDLKHVGVDGHSFGGYTALAVGGAEIDFANLQKNCDRYNYVNLSLLLQCRALNLTGSKTSFRDPRVTAIMARNPLNSSIFGRQGLGKITIPTFLIAGSYDIATPVVFEQMFSFPWLVNTPTSYLGLIEGQAHVDTSKIDAGVGELV
jgi:predicted dienelactone hydrolase